ncbi:MAG: hypothetical protein DI585_01300 [Pseudomonas fluorescens]|nr:MAG: hypothetical protein DI585_01300 [Pseudomonas fluorescens]
MKIWHFTIAMLGLVAGAQAQMSLAQLCQPRLDEKYSDEFIAKCSGTIDPAKWPDPVGPTNAPEGAVTAPVAAPAQPAGPAIGSGEGADLDDLEQGTAGGIQTQYNNREMVKVGQFDALQGRPVNMQYANNLEYLQGYTQGQKIRAEQNGGAGGVPAVPREGIQLR